MKLLAEPSGSRHRLTWMVGAIALVSCALLGLAARAHASETIYWDNYRGDSIGTANIDGSGGRLLDLGSLTLPSIEGIAFDPANDRIYIADEDEIQWVGINGGAGTLDTGAAPVEGAEGIAVNPATQTVYWGNGSGADPIGYADANESGIGGALSATGSAAGPPHRIALDVADGRVYWVSGGGGSEVQVSYANLDGTGGGNLAVPQAEPLEDPEGLAVDPSTQRLYVLGQEQLEVEPGKTDRFGAVIWGNLSGVGGGKVDTANAAYDDGYGLAVDPSLGRVYWGNYGSSAGEPTFGTATLAGGGGAGITVAETTENISDGPQDPVVLKAPTAVAVPAVTGSGTALSCSTGSWSQNYVGSSVYGAPESYGYQWSKDGQSIAGANGTTLNATASGSYTCAVTATNQFGSAAQTSAAYTVTIAPPATPKPAPASFALAQASKKKIKVAAGKAASLPLTLKNAGGTTSSSSKVCVKLTKKAKKGLVGPKCVAVAALAPGASKKVTLKVKTKGTAKGTYKFSVVISGASGSGSLAEQITVTAKKKHNKK